MDPRELLAALLQRPANYDARQVAGQGVVGQALAQHQAALNDPTAVQAAPQPAPQPSSPQSMSPAPPAGAGANSKQAIIAQVVASGDPVRMAQLRKIGWIQ